MDNLVEFRNITKHFPGITALNHVNLELKKGEVHVLVGENGAGKSTLMRILSGAIEPTEGELFIKGGQLKKNSPKISSALGVSMIYQELDLIPELSIMENIFLGSELKKGPLNDRGAMYEKTKEYLRQVNIHEDPRTLVKNLGIGTQQMVEIAKALSKNSDILVLDEPTSSLTDLEIKELFRNIRLLRDRGVGMFYISHRMEELYEIGDRITIMRDGNVIGSYGIKDINIDQVIEKIAGRKIENLYPHVAKKQGPCVLEIKDCTNQNFSHVNLTIHAGEIVGLSGLVGAGRTELSRAVFGVDDYRSGEILVEGKKIPKNDSRKAVEAGIGLLPEDRKVQGLALLKSIRENMTITALPALNPRGVIDKKKEQEISRQYLKDLSIAAPSAEKLSGLLSGGTQQKVVVAKWLIAHLKVFIFDEPTRGIDVGTKSEIYQLMDNLAANGAAILMISSDLPEILGMSDRIYVMAHGQIMGEVQHDEADQNKVLQLAYKQ